MTVAGWGDARAWGLAPVVDLRCTYEVGPGAGDPAIPEEALSGITIVNAPTEDQDDPEFMEVCVPILDSPEYWPTTGGYNPSTCAVHSKQSPPHCQAHWCTAVQDAIAPG